MTLSIFPLTHEKIQHIPLAGALLEYFVHSKVLGMLFFSFEG